MQEFKAVRNLRIRYLIGLSVIALLVTASWFTLQTVVAKQANYSKIVNIASHQRGIAERIALFSMTMATAGSQEDYETANAQLGRAIGTLERAHQMLLEGDAEKGIPKISNPILETIYFDEAAGLDIAVERYRQRARVIYEMPFGELSTNSPEYIFIQQYGPHVINFMFDSAVDEYEAIGNRAIKRIQNLETLLWISALFILAIEIIFIFRPMERQVRKALNVVMEKKEALEKTVVELVSAKSSLMANEEKFKAMASNVPGVIFQMSERRNGDRGYLYVSPRCQEIYGVTPEELQKDWEALKIHPDDRQRFLDTIREAFNNQSEWSFEGRVLTDEGDEKWCRGISTPVPINDDETVFNGLIVDITRQKEMEDKLRKLATTDPLTGAFNRRHFLELAEQEITRARRQGHKLSVLMVDIDHFKKINDTHGHPAGDAAINATVETIKKQLRRIDVISRFGGEEFVVMLPETPVEGGAVLGERIRKAVSDMTVNWENTKISFTISIGLAAWRTEDQSIENVLKRVDDCLYLAKAEGRNRVITDGSDMKKTEMSQQKA